MATPNLPPPGERRPNLSDAMGYCNYSSLTMLPGDRAAVFCLKYLDVPRLKYVAQYYRADLDQRRLRELPLPEDAACLCAAAGEYALAFARGKTVFLAKAEDGRAREVAELPSPPTKLAASPDGSRLLAVVETPDAEEARLRSLGIVIQGTRSPTQVFTIDLRSGAVTAATSGPTVKRDADWSPEGRRIVYTEETPELPGAPARASLRIVDAMGGGDRLLLDGDVRCSSPRWSPDGATIAFLMRPPTPFANDVLTLIPAEGGPVRPLTASLDRRAAQVVWAAKDDLRFVVAEGMYLNLWRADAATGALERLSSGDTVWEEMSLRPGGRRMIYCAESISMPRELFIAGAEGRGAERLTDFNASWREDRSCSSEIIQWKNSLGMTIEGIWMRPAGVAGGAPPLIVESHGATPGAYAATFFPIQRSHAASGYATLLVNYRGSAYYDQAFMEAIIGCWCKGPAEDIITGTERLIAAKAVDARRVGITGASGGGLMGAAAIGLSPIFRAAVLVCGWYDFAGLYREGSWSNIFDRVLGGSPLEAAEAYRAQSPATYAPNVRAAVLLLCGEDDRSAPIIQTELYYALLRRYTTVQFVRYQNEGHALRDPARLLDCQTRTFDWFRQYLAAP